MPMAEKATPPSPPICPCGYDRTHPHVIGEAQYTGVNFMLGLLIGMSMGNPKSVRYRCVMCKTVIEESFERKDRLDHRN